MRRIPFIMYNNSGINYVCPNCMKVVPRDLYVLHDTCPSCNSSLNKVAKRIINIYKMYDTDFYNIFIHKVGGAK